MSAFTPKADIPQHHLDVRFVPLGDIAKSSSDVLSLYFFATLQENKRFLLYGASETISEFRGGMPSLCSTSQDGRAKDNIAGNGSGVDEARGRSRAKNSQERS
jgi:hypothetical protein